MDTKIEKEVKTAVKLQLNFDNLRSALLLDSFEEPKVFCLFCPLVLSLKLLSDVSHDQPKIFKPSRKIFFFPP